MGGGGEVVQVHGGHIIRSTAGKKDRHSKVYTAKGPRDRRVRLAAHTAIQFYDVQDRLGFDRPSKAVDWLMEKAHRAIDNLPQLPPFDPNAATLTAPPPPPPPKDTGLLEPAGFGGTVYPHRDLCLSLQSFENGAGTFEPEGSFPAGYGGGWAPDPAEMGRFSRLLAWDGGERGTLQSNFQSQPLIRNMDDVSGDLARDHLQQQHQQALEIGILGSDRFMEFCVPNQMGGDGMITLGHHHRGASSMSTTTDSSH